MGESERRMNSEWRHRKSRLDFHAPARVFGAVFCLAFGLLDGSCSYGGHFLVHNLSVEQMDRFLRVPGESLVMGDQANRGAFGVQFVQ